MLDFSLNSVGPFWVNGVGSLRKKGGLFGNKLLVGSLGEKKGGGVPKK